jgi:multidrug efflux pump subunit AcrA (membrane-fusion protein)
MTTNRRARLRVAFDLIEYPPRDSNSTMTATETDNAASSTDTTRPVLEKGLVEQTRFEIRALLGEIADLAKTDVGIEKFAEGILNRVVSALAAVAGAIWTVDEDGELTLVYSLGMAKTGLANDVGRQRQHGLLLKKTLLGDESLLVGPQSVPADKKEAGNPTDYLLLLDLFRDGEKPKAIIEVFQRPGAGPTTQRGYARFLGQVSEIAGEYLKNRRLRQFTDQQDLWQQLERFFSHVHGSLDPQQTTYAIANEARRLLVCDRVSVAVGGRGGSRIKAVSGVDTVDNRSANISLLTRLAAAVTKAGEAVWYTGDTSSMPPQIEEVLQRYVDISHAKMVAVLPLTQSTPDDGPEDGRSQGKPRPIGALIIERMDDDRADEQFRHRGDVIARHSSAALANALQYDGLFLMPVWKALSGLQKLFLPKHLPKTTLVLAAVVAAVVALCVVPAELALQGQGKLQPTTRQEIYAETGGVVESVSVSHGKQVAANSELARLRNRDLDVQIAGLIGKRNTTREQISSLSQTMLREHRLSPERQHEIAGRLAQLKETAANLDHQLALYEQKKERLIVRSPIDGQVVTWQVHDRLIYRRVDRGQALMTVVDPSGDWELELLMPESRMGHVSQAFREAQKDGEDLTVTFTLATHPGEEFEGTVREIHAAADVRSDVGNSVLVKVAIDKNKLPDLRPGSAVTAKVNCGARPVGYVWFHDLINFVNSKVLFWF